MCIYNPAPHFYQAEIVLNVSNKKKRVLTIFCKKPQKTVGVFHYFRIKYAKEIYFHSSIFFLLFEKQLPHHI